jgi:hypothetical protein
MNTIFEWQKQQVDERVQGALKNAASYRLVKEGSRNKPLQVITLKTALGLGVLLFLIGLILSACNPSQPDNTTKPITKVAAQFNQPTSLTIAKRISFQDRLAEQAFTSAEFKFNSPARILTMAERIKFQDHLEEQYPTPRAVEKHSVQDSLTWTMAERIQYHDRLGK